MTKFNIQLRRRSIPLAEIAEDIKAVATKVGAKTVTAMQYADLGQFGVNTVLRKFKSWNKALEAAGLEAPNRQHVTEEELFENLANVWGVLGRQPFGRDMEKAAGNQSQYSLGTYEKRFGSWNRALESFGIFINEDPKELGSAVEIAATPIKKPSRTSRKINWRLRAIVLIRDNCICKMCGASPAKNSDVELHIDHVMPWSKGGETEISNLQTLCAVCNIGKSDFQPE